MIDKPTASHRDYYTAYISSLICAVGVLVLWRRNQPSREDLKRRERDSKSIRVADQNEKITCGIRDSNSCRLPRRRRVSQSPKDAGKPKAEEELRLSPKKSLKRPEGKEKAGGGSVPKEDVTPKSELQKSPVEVDRTQLSTTPLTAEADKKAEEAKAAKTTEAPKTDEKKPAEDKSSKDTAKAPASTGSTTMVSTEDAPKSGDEPKSANDAPKPPEAKSQSAIDRSASTHTRRGFAAPPGGPPKSAYMEVGGGQGRSTYLDVPGQANAALGQASDGTKPTAAAATGSTNAPAPAASPGTGSTLAVSMSSGVVNKTDPPGAEKKDEDSKPANDVQKPSEAGAPRGPLQSTYMEVGGGQGRSTYLDVPPQAGAAPPAPAQPAEGAKPPAAAASPGTGSTTMVSMSSGVVNKTDPPGAEKKPEEAKPSGGEVPTPEGAKASEVPKEEEKKKDEQKPEEAKSSGGEVPTPEGAKASEAPKEEEKKDEQRPAEDTKKNSEPAPPAGSAVKSAYLSVDDPAVKSTYLGTDAPAGAPPAQ